MHFFPFLAVGWSYKKMCFLKNASQRATSLLVIALLLSPVKIIQQKSGGLSNNDRKHHKCWPCGTT
jgi:hypothetical protein